MRNYGSLQRRIEALERVGYAVAEIGSAFDLSIYRLTRSAENENAPTVLMSAGTHGDEPAGVEALMRALETDAPLLARFDLTVFPCVNPSGYRLGTRENADGVDINRSFENDEASEAVIVKQALSGDRFDLFIEFHEDWEAPGFYLFELRRNGEGVAPKLIQAVAEACPILPDGEFDGMNVLNGVIQPEGDIEEYGHSAMPLYVFNFHSDHEITCESPSGLAMETRIAAHLAALNAALEHVARRHASVSD